MFLICLLGFVVMFGEEEKSGEEVYKGRKNKVHEEVRTEGTGSANKSSC